MWVAVFPYSLHNFVGFLCSLQIFGVFLCVLTWLVGLGCCVCCVVADW